MFLPNRNIVIVYITPPRKRRVFRSFEDIQVVLVQKSNRLVEEKLTNSSSLHCVWGGVVVREVEVSSARSPVLQRTQAVSEAFF